MFDKRKATAKVKQVYTNEQLRYMIAPSVVDPIARSVGGPNPSQYLLQRLREAGTQSECLRSAEPPDPRSVPLIGTIGGSARSNAQLRAYREPSRER